MPSKKAAEGITTAFAGFLLGLLFGLQDGGDMFL
jgi:hypothetical protein